MTDDIGDMNEYVNVYLLQCLSKAAAMPLQGLRPVSLPRFCLRHLAVFVLHFPGIPEMSNIYRHW